MRSALFILLLAVCHLAGAADAKPNVLLIMADDLRDHGGVFSRELVKTPHLDRLAARGVRFTRACAQYPVCNPSRSSLLTGLRCEQTGVVGNQVFFRDVVPDAVTFPQQLRVHGWVTHSFGKVLHTANTGESQRQTWLDVGKSWDHAETVPPTSERPRGDIRNLTGGRLPWCEVGVLDGPEDEEPDARTAAAAIRSMESLIAAGKPWLVAAGFHRPHDPFHAPRKWFELYPREKLPLFRDPADASSLPALAITGGWRAEFAKFSDDDRRSFLQAYLAGVSFMDAQVGRLLDALDRLGVAERTVVIFLGDHGYHLGEREWWNKNTLFDRSCRAPLVIAAPGHAAGQECGTPVEFTDIFPTVADLCGVPVPPGVAGNSLRPFLKDPARPAPEAVAFTLVTRGEQKWGRSVRTARWRFTRWSDGALELYDEQADPDDMRNLAAQPEWEPVIRQLDARLATLPPWPKPARGAQ